MTWANLIAYGSGSIRYRLEIEGWPDVFVSDRSITYTNAGDRNVYQGLSCEGLSLRDRIIIYEGRCEADGITFRIKPDRRTNAASSWTDPITQSFSTRANPVGVVTADMSSSTLTMGSLEGGGSLSNNTYYHLNTEVVYVTTWPGISSRATWNTTAQAHFAANGYSDPPLLIWDAPPTIEGRRAYLYAYGAGDDGSGDGTVIWRGIVRKPPRLARDGVTWELPCSPITDVLKQSLAGGYKTVRPLGIYHHSACSVRIRMISGTGAQFREPTLLVGWHKTEADMLAWINTALATELTASGADTYITSCELWRDGDGYLAVKVVTNATAQVGFALEISSPILGAVVTGYTGDKWNKNLTVDWVDGMTDTMSTSTIYTAQLRRPSDFVFDPKYDKIEPAPAYPTDSLKAVSPLGYGFAIMKSFAKSTTFGERWQTTDTTLRTTYPAWRIYVDQDCDGFERVYIPNTAKVDSPNYLVTATGYDSTNKAYYIEVESFQYPDVGTALPGFRGAPERGFAGFLTEETEIRSIRAFGTGVHVFDFVANLKTAGVASGNYGDTPFVTSNDLSTWAYVTNSLQLGAVLLYRDYSFLSAVPLDKMLAEEMKLINYVMRIGDDGKLDAIPVPSFTDAYPVDTTHTITKADILTPMDRKGAWPEWAQESDGRITSVSYQNNYNPFTDEWEDEPMVFQDSLSAAISKTRGRNIHTIKPYSTLNAKVLAAYIAFIGDGTYQSALRELALRHMALFARDYETVRIAVSFAKFAIQCGDVVSLTYQNIPDGNGNRGISARRGVVIERSWDLDPAGDGHGYLTIMLSPYRVAGYAPSAYVTSQTNTSGNTWAITCSTANTYNIAWSTEGDGYALRHFAAGDQVRVTEFNDNNPVEVVGEVDNVQYGDGTITVTFDAAWTPGVANWVLEFEENVANDATDNQKQYAYVADSTLLLADGTFARRFS